MRGCNCSGTHCIKKKCGNCLVCMCRCRPRCTTTKDRRKKFLREVELGMFKGTWNEYRSKCKQERILSDNK